MMHPEPKVGVNEISDIIDIIGTRVVNVPHQTCSRNNDTTPFFRRNQTSVQNLTD